MNNNDKYYGFREGMDVIIINEIDEWSSSLNSKSPRLSNLTYPYRFKIKKIKEIKEPYHIAMTCGEYGWSLSSLVKKNVIIINQKELRKEKLKKLKSHSIFKF